MFDRNDTYRNFSEKSTIYADHFSGTYQMVHVQYRQPSLSRKTESVLNRGLQEAHGLSASG